MVQQPVDQRVGAELDAILNESMLKSDPVFFYINDADELNYLKRVGISVSSANIVQILADFRKRAVQIDNTNVLENTVNCVPHEESFSISLSNGTNCESVKVNNCKFLLKKVFTFWRRPSRFNLRSAGSPVESKSSSCCSYLIPPRLNVMQEVVTYFNSSSSFLPTNKSKRSWSSQRHLKRFFKLP